MLQKLLSAPIDDEPETDEEREAVEQSKRELAGGQGIPHDEILSELSQ